MSRTATIPVRNNAHSAPLRGRRLPVLPARYVPAGLRVGAGFAAFFGTLWVVQGALAATQPALAGVAVAIGAGITLALWFTRHRVPRPPAPTQTEARRATRWVSRATLIQLAVSVPGGVAVQLLVDPTAVIPFVVITVGVYLLALAPVIGRAHLWVAGAVLTAVPVAVLLTLDGTDRVVVTGLVAGPAFLAKGVVDVVLAARRPR